MKDYRFSPGDRFSNAPWTFWARNAIFSSSVSKNGEVYTPEISRMKGTSVHIKNMWIKRLCNRKVEVLLWLYGLEKFPGISRNGPPGHKPSSAFEKTTTKNIAYIKLSFHLHRIFTIVFASYKLYLVAQLRTRLPFLFKFCVTVTERLNVSVAQVLTCRAIKFGNRNLDNSQAHNWFVTS